MSYRSPCDSAISPSLFNCIDETLNLPRNHNGREEDGRFQPLEKNLCQRLKDGIRDEEDGQSGVVFIVGHVQILLETIDLCISYVGSVQEGNKI